MIQKFAFLLLLLTALNSFSLDIRKDFHDKMFSEEGLLELMESESYPTNSITVGYKGVCHTMYADYCFLPTSKLSYFNTGVDFLEKAINKDKSNTELRYMRLLVQLNAPGFLGYTDNISEDINYFVKNLKSYSISDYWKKRFIENLLAGENLSASDKAKLTTLQNKLA